MRITFDQSKRDRTWIERGLAFESAAEIFAGVHVTIPDDRIDYGEPRFLTFGLLGDRAVSIVWTPREDARRVISMRYASERERKHFAQSLGRSG